MELRFPYGFDARGATAAEGEEAWIRGLIEQVLFTTPRERVMRPDFGSGLRQIVFAPNSPELAATTEMLVQGALQQWLGHLIVIETVTIEAVDSTLRVHVGYTIQRTQAATSADFALAGVGP